MVSLLSPRRRARPVANFGLDTGPAGRRVGLAGALAALALLGGGTWLTVDAAERRLETAETQRRIERSTQALRLARGQARDVPTRARFEALRARLDALNALDPTDAPSAGRLFDILEATLPDDAMYTSIDYDRTKGLADVVAVSADSEELTVLYGALHDHPALRSVRLLDKKQVSMRGGARTQVHMVIAVLPRREAVGT